MSQNPEVKLACNTELAFTEAHLIDLKPESCIQRQFFVFCRERAASHGSFLSRVSILTRGIDKSVRLSVCLSVCYVSVGLSDENGLTYRHSFFFTIRQHNHSSFTGIKHLHEIPTGYLSPPCGGAKYRWGIKILRFLTNKSLYLANDTRYRHSYYGRRIGKRT